MNPAILVIANLVLFVASIVAGFAATTFVTHKWIGFFRGARMAAFTEGDAKSQRKHRVLLTAALIFIGLIAYLSFVTLGAAIWSSYALAATIGLVVSTIAAYHMNKDSLLPEGWKRQD